MKEILSVTELTLRIKFLLESSFEVFWVEGEISNLRRPGSGHLYFTLKDKNSQIRAVIFKAALRRVEFDLEDGMQVILKGRLSVYEPRGEYQLIADAVEPRGLGALQKAFEQLRARLQEEGLFDPAHKRPIPLLPRTIGVITSPSGAVIRDILNITGRRFPSVNLLVAPVRVQGVEAPQEIVEAVAAMNEFGRAQVMIVARGGGSLEDLAPLNDERVARAIFNSRIPVISAVGHEIDFTIADFVADLRAPTPSAAAELVVPNRRELKETLKKLHLRLEGACLRRMQDLEEVVTVLRERLRDPRRLMADQRLRLDDRSEQLTSILRNGMAVRLSRLHYLNNHLRLTSPATRIREKCLRLESLMKTMTAVSRRALERSRKNLSAQAALLDSLSPLAVLRRGYGIARKLPEGMILKDAASVSPGDDVAVKLFIGEFQAKVVKREEG